MDYADLNGRQVAFLRHLRDVMWANDGAVVVEEDVYNLHSKDCDACQEALEELK